MQIDLIQSFLFKKNIRWSWSTQKSSLYMETKSFEGTVWRQIGFHLFSSNYTLPPSILMTTQVSSFLERVTVPQTQQ